MQSTQSPVNPRWLAPEILAGARATTASDVFSYGERLSASELSSCCSVGTDVVAVLRKVCLHRMCSAMVGAYLSVCQRSLRLVAARPAVCQGASHPRCAGVILYELLTWTVPWGGADFWEVGGS